MILQEWLEKWMFYLNLDTEEVLVQTVIMHAQFELLHPFKDGNGRIGRILIPLFLFYKRKMKGPAFYLSETLEEQREIYYVKLQNVSKNNDWNGWVEFFLQAIITQSQKNSVTVKKVMSLYEETKQKIQQITHSQYSVYLLDTIFSKPIFKSSDVSKNFETDYGTSRATTLHLINKLKDDGILREISLSSGRRSAVLAFPALINLLEGKKII